MDASALDLAEQPHHNLEADTDRVVGLIGRLHNIHAYIRIHCV